MLDKNQTKEINENKKTRQSGYMPGNGLLRTGLAGG
jgi:hypothetical protein